MNVQSSILLCILLLSAALNTSAAPPHPDRFFNRNPVTGEWTLKPSVNLAPYLGMDTARKSCVVQPDGVEYVLVLKIDFPDQPGRRSGKEINSYFFAPDEVSLKSYYHEVSYGQMDIQPGPAGSAMPQGNNWYRAKNEMSYYGHGMYLVERYRELVEEACNAADSDINFAQYDRDGDGVVDHVFVVHAGDDEASSGVSDDIWSILVSSVGGVYDGVRIDTVVMAAEEPSFEKPHLGIFFHEFFHDLGAPDLYGANQFIESFDQRWGLMGMFGPYQGKDRNGLSPSHICGYLKWDFDAKPENGRCGWIEPVEIKMNVSDLQIHSFELPPADNKLYKIDIPGKNGKEFFLIENRNKNSGGLYDTYLPESGILIWHIDENRPRGTTDASNRMWLEDATDPNHLDTENITKGAAYSADDNQTSFTPGTNPNSNANDGSVSGISITNIGFEGLYMPITVSFGDTYEPNNDLLSAFGPLVYGMPYESFIYDESDKVDFYEFEAKKGVPVIITLQSIPDSANYVMRILNSRSETLMRSEAKKAPGRTMIYRPTRTETLFIAVESLFGYSSVDSYILTVNSDISAPGLLRLEEVYSYPNPARFGDQKIFFTYLIPELQIPDEVKLEVFTINGELVYSTADTTASRRFEWNGKNLRDNQVANGIYYYVITAKRQDEEVRSSGKLAIQR
ncbi:TPA: M6 family metalloprotease domain-containing protein [Candidatus Poribacteria bacterium]|nr:M6 family metalloprotease domain-containing protein [Candidatus Poribacteria bacterium]